MLRLETGELAAFSVTVPEIYITVCTHVDISLPMGKFMYSCIYTCVQHTAAHAPSKISKNTVGASDWSLLATGAWCAIINQHQNSTLSLLIDLIWCWVMACQLRSNKSFDMSAYSKITFVK